ncbi:MAG: [Fe-Fe] hydrogenase large subunit C-terminal domain-containing protein [Clostridia bacterium]|nr:[Fe-Fe] hydrogenase large subunit C-terminal domain-containing protein [Clostridia bacterium]MDY5264883.1 [Fe-Fe] hydrogenase large subunit C-terminal domain-containing protein [Eubacteriales bacterium]MDY5440547.1 [Fe-Fe] hydrogenase large subunit C-terminal domain-containing protein [Eubacteriales bacterium]
MVKFLDFKEAKCKDCYKCLRECPVKAIAVIDHQAKIIDEKCILCGTCTRVCPQNAKMVHSELSGVLELLASGEKVVVSLAPSFVSSFGVLNLSTMKNALLKLGFYDVEETAIGAKLVTERYAKLLDEGGYKNFITSCCPAVNNLIEKYYPKAIEYLAKVDSPMVAHAKLLKAKYPDARIVFIGPCIAKKKEAVESGIIDGVLTYEDLFKLLNDEGIELENVQTSEEGACNKARNYPISRGIIKSLDRFNDNYEYLAIDGLEKCMEILENIENIDGAFLELNACEYACINGPCSLKNKASSVVLNGEVRKYAKTGVGDLEIENKDDVDITKVHYPQLINERVSESEIKSILAKTNKFTKEDELNCGACGYSSCRDKAYAVALGYADVEMCLPYMREKAETMSYEIIHNSPNGIILVDSDLSIVDMNKKAKDMLGVTVDEVKGTPLVDYYNPTDFLTAMTDKTQVNSEVLLDKTNIVANTTITYLKEYNVMFGIFTDITEQVKKDEMLSKMRMDTLNTTDAVIEKQMRVAQEIASLLGETTAETKIALINLKSAIGKTEVKDENEN